MEIRSCTIIFLCIAFGVLLIPACNRTTSVTPQIVMVPTSTFTLNMTSTATFPSTPSPTMTGTANGPTSTPTCNNPAAFGNAQFGNYYYYSQVAASREVFPSAVTVQSLSALVNGGGTVQLGIYLDTGGNYPGALLIQTAPQSVSLPDFWCTLPIPATILGPGTYWLAALNGTTGYLVATASSGQVYSYNTSSMSKIFPAGAYSDTNRLSMHANFCLAPGAATYTPTRTNTPTPYPTCTFTFTWTPTYTPTPTWTGTQSPPPTPTLPCGYPGNTCTPTPQPPPSYCTFSGGC